LRPKLRQTNKNERRRRRDRGNYRSLIVKRKKKHENRKRNDTTPGARTDDSACVRETYANKEKGKPPAGFINRKKESREEKKLESCRKRNSNTGRREGKGQKKNKAKGNAKKIWETEMMVRRGEGQG